MTLKGIEKGDSKFRHFTFDDEKVVTQNNVPYYEVTYEKDPNGGDYADEEVGYVPCSKVMTLGGRKPKPVTLVQPPVSRPEASPVTNTPSFIETAEEKPKRGRPKKVTSVKVDGGTYPIAPEGDVKFEYDIYVIKTDDINKVKTALNEKGQEGWEMCGFDTNKTFMDTQFIAILKRRI